jgi:hypothetical protein
MGPIFQKSKNIFDDFRIFKKSIFRIREIDFLKITVFDFEIDFRTRQIAFRRSEKGQSSSRTSGQRLIELLAIEIAFGHLFLSPDPVPLLRGRALARPKRRRYGFPLGI